MSPTLTADLAVLRTVVRQALVRAWETAAGPYLGIAVSTWVLLTMRRVGEL